MRLLEGALGAVVLLALGALLPLGLVAATRSPSPDLAVLVKSARPWAEGAGRADAIVRARAREPVAHEEPDARAGLGLETWSVTYAHRWEREVSLPILRGPFDRRGEAWACTIAARLAPEFFVSARGKDDVAAIVSARIRARFPFAVEGLYFPRVAATEIQFAMEGGVLEASARVTLEGGTRLFVTVPLTLSATRGGDVVVTAGASRLSWTGPTRTAAAAVVGGTRGAKIGSSLLGDAGGTVGGFVGSLIGKLAFDSRVDAIAQAEVDKLLATALSNLRFTLPTMRPFASRPGDSVTLRLCEDPRVTPRGIVFRLRPVVELATPLEDARVPGPTRIDAAPELPRDAPPRGSDANFEAVISPAGQNQLLYVLWQSGRLKAWWSDYALARRLRETPVQGDVVAADLLPFALDRVEPRLPPVLLGTPGAFVVRLADVAFGEKAGQTVVGHFDVEATLRAEDGEIRLGGAIVRLHANCASSPAAGEWLLTPCFSDVLPIVRERLATRPVRFEWVDRELLSKVPRIELADMNVTFGALGATLGDDLALRLTARIALEPRGAD